ncbi:hypothetical protein DAETH_43480 (plasmid) [Deinococcus aetherius]|uniref:Uncharacterized protein n=1 Tax=Deinococcus aetherius TaxID=200252 RepID=A0ABN6RNS9_9DEIO|nr:hypothetical protein [Deinococcus aetherius]BDP44379.1 hypothetical protein DAETH_43480 [Deinococcus aetherius]
MKQGFTAAVTRMFGTFILITLVGFSVTLFIPALPLRQGGRGEPRMGEVPALHPSD